MRLGVWNRLAIVLAGLALLIGPPAFMLNAAIDASEAEDRWYETCKVLADEKPEYQAQRKAREECLDEYLNNDATDGIWTWGMWTEISVPLMILCGVIYSLIFAVQWLIRWIWRGREQSNQQ